MRTTPSAGTRRLIFGLAAGMVLMLLGAAILNASGRVIYTDQGIIFNVANVIE